jgi:acyl-CoA thioester hydrolase
MGTFYNARILEWFELGRTELARALGVPYAEWERRGVMLPVIEAFVKLRGRATYDDMLEITSTVSFAGRARLRFDEQLRHADGSGEVAEGYTVHAIAGPDGRPRRAPGWVRELLEKATT